MADIEDAKRAVEQSFACIQTAPSIRTALGEAFGMRAGENVQGKLVSALRALGYKRVFETDFGAEVRVMEESKELKKRIDGNERLPMMTSCCPSWVGLCVKMYPDLVPHLSTCMSPMEMVSSLTKNYLNYGEDEKDNCKDSLSIGAVMPCFAKKREALRGQTDYVVTAMELAGWLKEEGIDLKEQAIGQYDNPFGRASSAGTIYASTGGVSEATLRTFSALFGDSCEGGHLYSEEILADGMREKTVICGDYRLKVAMLEGQNAIHRFCKDMLAGKNMDFHLVELMFCHGGCVGGPGMPNAGDDGMICKRIRALREYDDSAPINSAHINPLIDKLYTKHLGRPFSKESKKVLHVKDFNTMFG